MAGYAESGAYAHGHKLLKNAEISEAISQRLTESAMSADEVVKRLGEHARGTVQPFLVQREDSNNITIDLTTPQAQANLHLIKKISQKHTLRTRGDDEEVEDTTLTIELYDAQGALNTLAKHHGLLADKSYNFDIDLTKLNDEQLARIAKGEEPVKVVLDGYTRNTG